MSLRRNATITLHWVLLILLTVIAAGADSVIVYWSFVMCACLMVLLAVFKGLMSRPGPKLEGVMRLAHPWMHRALYAYLAFVAAVTTKALVTGTPDSQTLLSWFYILAGAVSFHAIFHLWRHTTLCDGALRGITPNAIHHML